MLMANVKDLSPMYSTNTAATNATTLSITGNNAANTMSAARPTTA
jgi:hypothetical protein